MKIAIVHYHLQPGGVTRVIENTPQAWVENGIEIEAVALGSASYPGDQLSNTRVIEGLDYASANEAIDPKILFYSIKEAVRHSWANSWIFGISIIIH